MPAQLGYNHGAATWVASSSPEPREYAGERERARATRSACGGLEHAQILASYPHLAEENFPGPALVVLRKAGWEVFLIAKECLGVSNEEVDALRGPGELVFGLGLPAGSGIVLFRITPESRKRLRTWHWAG